MGSQTHPKIPAIYLSGDDLTPGTTTWVSKSNEVRQALEDWGCFQAVYDKITPELRSTLFETVEELFNLPTEVKLQNTSSKPYHGYFGQYSTIPLYESLGMDKPTALEEAKSFTNLMWPNGNDRFCESAHSFAKIVEQLEQMVTRMIFHSYGVDRYCDSHIGSTAYLLRFFGYRKPEMDETNMGLDSHTDKTFISIIYQSRVNGLQIKAKDGEWVDVDPSPSSFLILAGDVLMAWCNDRIPSAYHRVIMGGTENRHSLGFFSFNTNLIQIPPELVDDDQHPLRYKPFDCYDYLRFNQTTEAYKSACAIKAYVGV